MRIDRISKQEDVQVRELIWKTFLRFDAVDYSCLLYTSISSAKIPPKP